MGRNHIPFHEEHKQGSPFLCEPHGVMGQNTYWDSARKGVTIANKNYSLNCADKKADLHCWNDDFGLVFLSDI